MPQLLMDYKLKQSSTKFSSVLLRTALLFSYGIKALEFQDLVLMFRNCLVYGLGLG